jgi:RNA polymerase sigma factor (TIGR02999 family)
VSDSAIAIATPTRRTPNVRRAIMPCMSEITQWLVLARSGDSGALERVFAALYPELRRLAQGRAAAGERTLTPTALVHEVYLRMLGSAHLELNDRRHFLACAARAMGAVAIDHARRRSAHKRGGRGDDIGIDAIELELLGVGSDDELIELDAALSALEKFNPKLRQVVELHFFAGLEFENIAELFDCSLRTIKREWSRARAFLHAQLADSA